MCETRLGLADPLTEKRTPRLPLVSFLGVRGDHHGYLFPV